jgi:hypothetical protein
VVVFAALVAAAAVVASVTSGAWNPVW